MVRGVHDAFSLSRETAGRAEHGRPDLSIIIVTRRDERSSSLALRALIAASSFERPENAASLALRALMALRNAR
jgi:hypothetical protein